MSSERDPRRKITLKDFVFTWVIASLVSFYAGKAAQQIVLPSLGSENGVGQLQPTDDGVEKTHGFVWVYSYGEDACLKEGEGDCFAEPETTHTLQQSENDDEDNNSDNEEEDDDDDEDDRKLQLTMNLRNVPHELIESEDAVIELMETIEEEFKLEIVAYGCHLLPHGAAIGCMGHLDDGHMSMLAWPKESTVLFDLFTTGKVGMEDMEILSKLFKQQEAPGVPAAFKKDFDFGMEGNWALKRRGDREPGTDYDYSMEAHNAKKEVASVQSIFQKIDVVDFHDKESIANLMDGLRKDEDYVLNNPQLFLPDRYLFLDGVTQSTRDGNAAYHESLVQPAMFAHKNPRRVAIIGGGECATLREVLKHNTIEKVVMIEIDEVIVEASKQHLPEWNDCSNFEGSSRYCMDDPRAEMFNEDAFRWFIDRFGANSSVDEPPFDVIILDALDPQNVVEFAEALYGDSSFMNALYNGLSEDGILVSQVGEAVGIRDPAQTYSVNKNRALFINSLTDQGFVNIFEFNEGNAKFDFPWSFNVAFKSLKSRYNWDDNSAMVHLKIKKRAIRTWDGESPFEYFDGADMQRRLPSKASEVVFCRQEPTPTGCEGRNRLHRLAPTNRRETVDMNRTHDLFARSYYILEDALHQIPRATITMNLVDNNAKNEILAEMVLPQLEALRDNQAAMIDGTEDIVVGRTAFENTENQTESSRRPGTTRAYVYNPAIARVPFATKGFPVL